VVIDSSVASLHITCDTVFATLKDSVTRSRAVVTQL
jgi:hypothetical protein